MESMASVRRSICLVDMRLVLWVRVQESFTAEGNPLNRFAFYAAVAFSAAVASHCVDVADSDDIFFVVVEWVALSRDALPDIQPG